jgi:2-deoxy-D-gluconate 3-dehydrogenase
MNVNLNALFVLCQAAGKHMIPRKSGKILNIASLSSLVGGIRVASYSASKAGVAGLTKALSNEWSKFNINVNAIAPGSIATDM